jgi:hypothetical protein
MFLVPSISGPFKWLARGDVRGVLTGILALDPDTSFARGVGGGGHIRGFHGGYDSGGIGAVRHDFHGPISLLTERGCKRLTSVLSLK